MKYGPVIFCFGMAAVTTYVYCTDRSFTTGLVSALLFFSGGFYQLDKLRKEKDRTPGV
jgi:hypothetical protein